MSAEERQKSVILMVKMKDFFSYVPNVLRQPMGMLADYVLCVNRIFRRKVLEFLRH